MNARDFRLQQFLAELEERTPLVPDELVEYHCCQSGSEVKDPRAVRLLGLATQKFITDIVQQAVHLSRVRDRLPFSRLKDLGFNPKNKTRVLLMEELLKTLKQFGIHGHHVPYFTNTFEPPRP